MDRADGRGIQPSRLSVGGGPGEGWGHRRGDRPGGVSAGARQPPHPEGNAGIPALAVSHRAQPGARAPSPPDEVAPAPLPAGPVLDPEREAERRIGDAEMADALRHLSPREREAIYLRFFEDAAYEDVAAIMRIADSTCRVLVHRALDKLRRHLTTQVDQKRETL